MKHDTTTHSASTPKPGFFKRIVEKLDRSMKAKAEAKSADNSCCGSSDDGGKGGKCC